MAQISNKEQQEFLNKVLPVMNPEQQAAALASFCTPEAHAAFAAECEAREAALYKEAHELYHRATLGERVTFHPILSGFIDWAPSTGDPDEVSFSSKWWIGLNGARCLVANAFSLQMLDGLNHDVHVNPIPEEMLPDRCVMESFVGHPDTAAVLGVQCNRGNLQLRKGDILFVAQLTGGRLPEGCTTLPEGFQIKWYYVTID